MLGPLEGAVVADVFAGTGALGIEALSRGASRVVFVEHAAPALAALSENLVAIRLGAPEAMVLSMRAERAVKSLADAGPFDLLLLDPPYAQVALAVRVLDSLRRGGGVRRGTRAVVEHARQDDVVIPGWERVDQRRYGDSTLSFFSAEDPSRTETQG